MLHNVGATLTCRASDLKGGKKYRKTWNYLASISVRKEISINFLELFHGKVAAWAIFEKSFVPFLYFGVYSTIKTENQEIKNNKQKKKY